MKKVNFIVGLVLLAGFLISGLYFKYYFMDAHFKEYFIRMEIRANHVYMFYLATINILAHKLITTETKKFSKRLITAFRVLILWAAVASVIAFFIEPTPLVERMYKGEMVLNINPRFFTFSTAISTLVAGACYFFNEYIYVPSKWK